MNVSMTGKIALVTGGELARAVDLQLGPIARPGRIIFVQALPKTRSGKVLGRVIQAVCEGRDAGDLTTIEDEGVIRELVAQNPA